MGRSTLGCALPLGILAVTRCLLAQAARLLLAWFAGFCLVANGAYLLGGAFLGGGGDDGGVILQQGGSRWQLCGFGAVPLPPDCIFGTDWAPISDLAQAVAASIARPPLAWQSRWLIVVLAEVLLAGR